MKETLFPGPVSAAIIDSMGAALLMECTHLLMVSDQDTQNQGKLTARHIEIIESYLSSKTIKQTCVPELASACGLSERHFAKLFKQQFGYPVSQHIKSAQIAKAKAYLLETDFQLKEIAYRLGFSSLAGFSFSFRAATGLSPSEFRKSE